MFKVKGSLSNAKSFAFDASAATLTDAFKELGTKLSGKVPAGVEITRVSFQKRGAILSEVQFADVKKRDRTTPATAAPAVSGSTGSGKK